MRDLRSDREVQDVSRVRCVMVLFLVWHIRRAQET